MPQATADRTFLADHWTPMPDWTPERALLACYVTVADHPVLTDVVDRYQRALADVPELGPIARQWLHATVQGVGFLDVLGREALPALADVLRPRLAALPVPTAVVERPRLGRDAVSLPLSAADGLVRVRAEIRAALADTLGMPEPYALPGQRSTFRPHVSLAYAHTPVAAAPIRERLAAVAHDPFVTTLGTVSVLALRRTDRTWHWTDEVRLTVGPGPSGT